jgi:hypothetical protein
VALAVGQALIARRAWLTDGDEPVVRVHRPRSRPRSVAPSRRRLVAA